MDALPGQHGRGASTVQPGAQSGGDRSKKPLAFRTGGMRGIMKEGRDGINETTCSILGAVLARRYSDIVIGYDQRANSEEFAQIVAAIFLEHGKRATVFRHCTTPYLAFESTDFDVGLMITASHNAKEYNGFKVYVSGAQIVEPLDRELEHDMQELRATCPDSHTAAAGPSADVPCRGSALGEVIRTWASRLSSIDYGRYFDALGVERPAPARFEVRPVFSALHGVSGSFMAEACRHFGMEMDLASPQNVPDSSFGGIAHPNPENAANYDALTLRGRDATIFMCDPDGDRFGLCTTRADESGRQVRRVYNGDEIAKVFLFYLLEKYPRSQIRLVNTFLCGGFFASVSRKLGIPHRQTETGFKHVSLAVRSFREEAGEAEPVVLAYEDPLGFLIKSGAEKDGVKAAIMMYRILQEYELDGIFTRLEEFGVHSTHTVHIRLADPKSALQAVLARTEFGAEGDRYTIHSGQFKTVLRISGTESLIKIYTTSELLGKEELVEAASRWIAENVYAVLGIECERS